jgi:CSLREA domain-containing protein
MRPNKTPILTVCAVLVAAASVVATEFTVDSTADAVDVSPGDGACKTATKVCTLRAAIMETNALPGEDAITLPAGTYTLTLAGRNELAATTGDLNIADALTIFGDGSETTIIDAAGIDRVFEIHSPSDAAIVFVGITVQNGSAETPGETVVSVQGGGIYVEFGGNLSLEDCLVQSNAANQGGGIWALFGTVLTITNSTLRDNHATDIGIANQFGGAIYTRGELTITGSTISENSAGTGGGVDFVNSDDLLVILNSTISGNIAGGVHTQNADAQITNSTIANNTPYGVRHFSFDGSKTVVLSNTILANPDANCAGTDPVSISHNLSTDASCGLSSPGDQENATALLAALANNGGPTQTHALLFGSNAIDSADPADCPTTDQRGFARPRDGDGNGSVICDIGALESDCGSASPDVEPDADVDLSDIASFQTCFTSTGSPISPISCETFDTDCDGDIDYDDYKSLEVAITGP